MFDGSFIMDAKNFLTKKNLVMVGVVAVILVTVIIVIATSGGNNGSVGESGSPSLSNTKNFARLTEEE